MKSRHGVTFVEEGKWTSGADSTMLVGDWQAWVDSEGHWKVRGPDPDNEDHYADGDIELTEAEYIEAGNSEARRKIRARRAKEAARAYIKTMTQPSKRQHAQHATRKTSPTQLDREIAEALAKDYRVMVRVEGAPKPVHVSPWMTRSQAEHAAKNHKAMIRDRGWTHVVEIEDKSGAVTRLPR